MRLNLFIINQQKKWVRILCKKSKWKIGKLFCFFFYPSKFIKIAIDQNQSESEFSENPNIYAIKLVRNIFEMWNSFKFLYYSLRFFGGSVNEQKCIDVNGKHRSICISLPFELAYSVLTRNSNTSLINFTFQLATCGGGHREL